MTIYIDLDHTLLDTERFKSALQKALRPLGISKSDFVFAYARLRRRRSFAIEPFVALLELSPLIQKKALRALKKETARAERFLYPDVFPFLRYAKKRKGVRVVIFTYGDPGFHRMKLKGMTKLKSFIDGMIITSKEKKNIALPRVSGNVAIIDNRPEVVEYYAKRYGMMPIILDRPSPSPLPKGEGGRRSGEGHYRSLAAVAKMLERKWIV